MISDSFLNNHKARQYFTNNKESVIAYIDFHETILKNIKSDLADIKRRGLAYLIEPFQEQVDEYQSRVDEANRLLNQIGEIL